MSFDHTLRWLPENTDAPGHWSFETLNEVIEEQLRSRRGWHKYFEARTGAFYLSPTDPDVTADEILQELAELGVPQNDILVEAPSCKMYSTELLASVQRDNDPTWRGILYEADRAWELVLLERARKAKNFQEQLERIAAAVVKGVVEVDERLDREKKRPN